MPATRYIGPDADPTISCVIASYGAVRYRDLAETRALPSTRDEFTETITVHEPDGTLAQVRNEGARLASGDWLFFLDADDEVQPGFGDAIRRAVSAHPRAYGFTPAVSYGRRARWPAPKIWPRMENLQDGNWLIIGTVIPRWAFAEAGGFREWPLYEDWCLWQRVEQLPNFHGWVEVPDAVYRAHMDPRSRNRAPSRTVKEETHHAIRRANFPHLYG